MKKLFLFIAVIAFTAILPSCNQNTDKVGTPDASATTHLSDASLNAGGVQVYYFHLTSRCATCKTIEAEVKSDLQALYGEKVPFHSVNIEDEANNALTNRLQINSQTLLIVKGDSKIDITNEGFMYAVSDPDKLKSVVKEKVDSLL